MNKAYVIVLICLFQLTVAIAESVDKPEFLKEDKDGGLWYRVPSNNGIFVMHYQLDGVFERASSSEDSIVLVFTGDLSQLMSGNQLGNNGGETVKYRCQTDGVPLRIMSWSEVDSKQWGSDLRTFDETSTLFAPNQKYRLRMALRNPQYQFADNGDLIAIEASQIHMEESIRSE